MIKESFILSSSVEGRSRRRGKEMIIIIIIIIIIISKDYCQDYHGKRKGRYITIKGH